MRLGRLRVTRGRARNSLWDCRRNEALPSPGPASRGRSANRKRRVACAGKRVREKSETPARSIARPPPPPSRPATCEFGVNRLLAALRNTQRRAVVCIRAWLWAPALFALGQHDALARSRRRALPSSATMSGGPISELPKEAWSL